MSLSAVRFRFTLALAALCLLAGQAQAHFPWLAVDDDGRALVFFGERPDERNYHLPEALAAATDEKSDEAKAEEALSAYPALPEPISSFGGALVIEAERPVVADAGVGLAFVFALFALLHVAGDRADGTGGRFLEGRYALGVGLRFLRVASRIGEGDAGAFERLAFPGDE